MQKLLPATRAITWALACALTFSFAVSMTGPQLLAEDQSTIAAKDDEGAVLPTWGKKKDEPKQAAPGGPSGVRKAEEPPFEEVVKDADKLEGLFTIFHKDDRYMMAISPEQLDRDYMVSVTRETGIGESFLLAAQVLGDGPVRFHKVGKRIQMLWRNTRFAALDDPDIRRAVDKSFSDSLQGSARIESQPHPDSKAVLVDISPFFLTDYEAVGITLGTMLQAPYNLDRENCSIESLRTFPANMEVQARVHFASGKPAPFVNVPDSRSLFVTYRYSITDVPASADFIPRIADDRVGHFLALYQDFSDDRRETPYVRYVTRWNLQKEEPYAAMSKPKEPITFWLENNIPKQYRKAVADGVLLWNKAFEKIGFTDAVVVKQQPDDADWDPADVRYSTIRWFVTTQGAFAIGPSRINPMTGQIFDADIGVAESIVRLTRREFEELADPVAAIKEIYRSTMMDPAVGGPGAPGAPGARLDPRLMCTMGAGALREAAFGFDLLQARGIEPGTAAADDYINTFITHVIAHEVGHTLGLRHNFRASVVQPLNQLQNVERMRQEGLTGSVMDYIPVNIAGKGEKQGDYWQTELGQYDYWAIEYAYKPIDGVKRPEDELPELKRIASRVAESGNAYGTDEDSVDPRTSVWDIGSDPIAFYRQRAALSKELWKNIPTRLAKEGEGYQVMRRAFMAGMGEFVPSIGNVTKFIGGVYSNRDHVGDPNGRLPLRPVPADKQREALQLLRTTLFASDSFDLPADLLNKLASERWWDFTGSVFRQARLEMPLHDIVVTLQYLTLNQLYRPVTLDRLNDLEMHFPAGEKPFTMAEMFNGLRDTIWSELAAGSPRIDSFRRALQREHLKKLIDLVTRPPQEAPEDAGTLARANLTELKGRIDTALRGPSGSALDAGTKAHLEETRARIEAALSASMLRLTS